MTLPVIRRAICRVLALAEPHPLPQTQLFAQVNELLRPPIDKDTLKENLSFLLDRDMAAFRPDPMDPENDDAREWFLKSVGEAMLRK